MPLARVVVPNPESAQELVALLCLRGFEVEAVTPDCVTAEKADLEIDLTRYSLQEALDRAALASTDLATPGMVAAQQADTEPSIEPAVVPETQAEPESLAQAQSALTEEPLSDWPLWRPLEELPRRVEVHAQELSSEPAAEGKLPHRFMSLKPAIVAVGLIVVLGGAAMLLHGHHRAEKPVVEDSAVTETIVSEPVTPEAINVTRASVKTMAMQPSVLVPHRSARHHAAHDDSLIARDTTVRYGQRNTAASAAVQRKAAAKASRHSERAVVAEDTVVRYHGR